jgi:SAM-dependent methyltransferase
MVTSVYDLRAFYECRRGKVVHPLLQDKILSIWPEAKGLRMAGCGYAVPFLAPYVAEAERVVAIMPARFGAHHWDQGGKNLACLAEESELPIETESIDRLLLIHSLEHTEIIGPYLQEIWRVMKSNGKILIVAPNRHGFWSRAEWSPFGHGTPFSASQLARTLRDNLFVVERIERALYVPAFRSSVLLRACLPFEQYGRYVMGGMAGILMVEASKQLYSGVLAQHAAKVQIRGRRILIPSAAGGS